MSDDEDGVKGNKIQWCDSAVNPVQGCGGCELWTAGNHTCYAGRITERFGGSNPGLAANFTTPELKPGKMAEHARKADLTGLDRIGKPWLSGLPRHVFVSDMGDALTEKGFASFRGKPVTDTVLFNFLKTEIFDTVRSDAGVRHQWMWLTKRPHRLKQLASASLTRREEWPLNLWVGTSATGKTTMSRVRQLAQFGDDSTTRFLSVEPQWEPLSLKPYLDRLHWVIIGGEAGRQRKSTAFDLDWARDLITECQEACVPVFVKQVGSNPIENDRPFPLEYDKAHGGDWNEWPEELRVRQMPVTRIAKPTLV